MSRTELARTALLDAAERLFAESGIAQVSDRRVAEAAGNTNHSAVGYYFGGRDGLLRALVARHIAELEEARAALPAQADSVLGDVRSLVISMTSTFEALPRPTWRARFLGQALYDPDTAPLIRDLGQAPMLRAVTDSLISRLSHLDRGVVAGRAGMMVWLIATACSEVEARTERDGQDPRWSAVGDFLSDAIAGMLLAPISRPSTNPLTQEDG